MSSGPENTLLYSSIKDPPVTLEDNKKGRGGFQSTHFLVQSTLLEAQVLPLVLTALAKKATAKVAPLSLACSLKI